MVFVVFSHFCSLGVHIIVTSQGTQYIHKLAKKPIDSNGGDFWFENKRKAMENSWILT